MNKFSFEIRTYYSHSPQPAWITRIVESQSLDLDVDTGVVHGVAYRIEDYITGYNEMRADLINRAEAGDARASALLVQVDARCRPRKMYQLAEATTALSTDRQSGCSNESTKDGSRE